MKKLNKTSKFFILMTIILALSVVLSITAFGAGISAGAKPTNDIAQTVDEYRWYIEKIEFVESSPFLKLESQKAIHKSWNVKGMESYEVILALSSETLKNEETAKEDVRYGLYIVSENKLKAPADMSYFFADFANLKSINGLDKLDTSAVTNMQGMFAGCSSLKTLDLSELKTENVTDMSFMFRGCSSLEEITLDNFNTEKVTHMAYMFADCVKLPEIYVDSFNTKAVRDAQYMFFNCQKLGTIYVGDNWLFINIESSSNMFKNCYLLEGKKAYDPARTDAAYASTEYYTVHVSILNGDPVVLKVMDNLYVGQEKPVPEYIGYHYFNMIESFESSAPDVVYVNDKGDFVAAGVGRAHITAKLKENINGEITFTFSVEEKVIEAPEGVSLLSDILEVIKGWFNTIMEKIKSIFSFSFLK